MVLFKKNNPGCQCCTETVECAGCTDVPSEVTIDIVNTADDRCSNCDEFDGQYVLTYLNGTATSCTWRYIDEDYDWGCPYDILLQSPTGTCPDTQFVMTLTYNSITTRYTLSVQMGECVLNYPTAQWRSNAGIDCDDSPVALPHYAAGTTDTQNCDWSSSSATLTL